MTSRLRGYCLHLGTMEDMEELDRRSHKRKIKNHWRTWWLTIPLMSMHGLSRRVKIQTVQSEISTGAMNPMVLFIYLLVDLLGN